MQSDVKVPETLHASPPGNYIRGVGYVNNRIKAWRTKYPSKSPSPSTTPLLQVLLHARYDN